MKGKATLYKISNEYQSILGNNLVGIYLHGSLAFGCFNPNKSDIDFLVVVNNAPTVEEKEKLIETLLHLSKEAPAKGYEMSVVLSEVCKNFVYPTPFELHYSIANLQRCKDNLKEYCTSMKGTDKDLAAHFTVIKKVGYNIFGERIEDVFGEVSKANYLDSIRSDVENATDDIVGNPIYFILNLCRVLAYKNDGLVLSKEQGGLWGIEKLPEQYYPLTSRALNDYKSEIEGNFDKELLLNFSNYMIENIFDK
jgi:streptomycin 3"-adenylyltransferase